MVTIYIDDIAYQVKDGINILEACVAAGCDLPYFCWHPAMGSVGACRQCAVTVYQNEEDTRGRLVTGCMTPVTENMRLSIKSSNATEFRGQVIEALMTNHPHDCPVCEEGGECHLQDMTIMSGHTSRRYRGKKRTHRNQYLGPFINHEMNRCIACYRCVRYYRDYAGGDDLNVFGAHNHVYFGRSEDGVLENEFSGNLVEVCPTGVFTDKTFSDSYTRKWDLQTAPSVCVHCSFGCNTSPGERYGQLKRVVNRYNSSVNGYFLCDRGRFGYEFVNSENRIDRFLCRNVADRTTDTLSYDEAYQTLKTMRRRGKTIGIGSARASLEANFALRQFVGDANFYPGFSDNEKEVVLAATRVLKNTKLPIADLERIEASDLIIIVGEDLTNTSPRLALAVRQAARNLSFELAQEKGIPAWQDDAVRTLAQDKHTPIFIANTQETKLDDIATNSVVSNVCMLACMVESLTGKLDSDSAKEHPLSDKEQDWIKDVCTSLKTAKKPLIISGCSQYSPYLLQVIESLANVVAKQGANREASLYLTLPEVNSLGVGLLVDEGRDSNTHNKSDDLEQASPSWASLAKTFESGECNTLVVLENDLYRKADEKIIDHLLEQVGDLVVLDHKLTATAEKADLFMPTATFSEASGVYVNGEGRAQYAYQVKETSGDIVPAWRCFIHDQAVTAHQLLTELAREMDCFQSLGDLLDVEAELIGALPRQTHRYSGRTAKKAHENVHEQQPIADRENPLRNSMEGVLATANTVSEHNIPAQMVPAFWSPGWNSNQSVNKFQQEINGPLKGGNSGVRLLNPETGTGNQIQVPVSDHTPPENRFWLSPCWHIYGSEELSNQSTSIQQRIPFEYARLSQMDAEKHGLREGDKVLITLHDQSVEVVLLTDAEVAAGTLLMPVGLPELPFIGFGQWAEIEKTNNGKVDIQSLLPHLSRQRRHEILIASDREMDKQSEGQDNE